MIALRHQTGTPAPRPEPLPSHSARTLTEGGTQARIELDGQIYTLRITRAGKLILTK
ncbi:MAG: hemin uptake protein HemP [Paracoccaceae bacterium]|jgi:hemin uptake protein HemP|uniref:hemin uptake protein HemP n=1 Tax=unclassified Seohaeicola TaxID=2641111 RepID=UPI00237A99A4|nr:MULTISPECIES: hemin uptake protein HemP [unclassified Seohaeicola]MDD9708365.1 hemin uptake protein HemP [Seohaeicola sp. 4SK31]MDD9736480.1 hemin uptake protein HemP [Seohaeicola sp. SP36]MDF1707093.1 hemin uptake protein HemP [Paracoccaceae bacterium]MDM7970760.1 hemin uptake protein HemP [Paracoccaceae bacterium]